MLNLENSSYKVAPYLLIEHGTKYYKRTRYNIFKKNMVLKWIIVHGHFMLIICSKFNHL